MLVPRFRVLRLAVKAQRATDHLQATTARVAFLCLTDLNITNG